ncbi:hypothetical protein C4K68_21180 [Pokkaliibacter plantistimulans]|uniref:Uncharacterized protein n=1 Tax=Proteobacteria bacterium 228 TaxID=2083153 RepID=A0A2S5KJZ4_9PROT|nr:hypothetical protein [Pokkaliibacter plantistimulans]PPC75157.1 hypothetical protein C4K68_21180 [Pokkaliibacter plantistimulans]
MDFPRLHTASTARRSKRLGALLSGGLLAAGCTLVQADDGAAPQCQAQITTLMSLPVLDGTETFEPRLYHPSPDLVYAQYSVELGDTLLEVSIDPQNNTLTRWTLEAGEEEDVRHYQLSCDENGRFSGDGVEGMAVDGGLLLYEAKAGDDSIPDDLALFYSKDH